MGGVADDPFPPAGVIAQVDPLEVPAVTALEGEGCAGDELQHGTKMCRAFFCVRLGGSDQSLNLGEVAPHAAQPVTAVG